MSATADIEVTVDDVPADTYFVWKRNCDGKAENLSAAAESVTVKFRSKNNIDESLWQVTATKRFPALGILSFAWPATGLAADDTPAGRYQLEFTKTNGTNTETARNVLEVQVDSQFPDA